MEVSKCKPDRLRGRAKEEETDRSQGVVVEVVVGEGTNARL